MHDCTVYMYMYMDDFSTLSRVRKEVNNLYKIDGLIKKMTPFSHPHEASGL